MSQTLSNRLRLSHPGKSKVLSFLLILSGVGTLATVLYLQDVFLIESTKEQVDIETIASTETEPAPTGTLTLPLEKIKAGNIKSKIVSIQEVQHHHTVPGRLMYDETRHIDIKTPIAGILSNLLVKPGDKVAKGTLLAVVSSAEIGRARSDILRSQSLREIAQTQYQRMKSINTNLNSLLQELKTNKSVEAIENRFQDKPLGDYRQKILAVYYRHLLEMELFEKAKPLSQSGAIAGRQIREREANMQVARAEYKSVCDQSRYDSSQSVLEAKAELAEAERQLKIAQDELRTLLGSSEKQAVEFDSESLSHLEILAPFEGTIESLSLARNERLTPNASICILADTSVLYVSADIRENEWDAVQLQPGSPVQVTTTALPNQELTAIIHYVGREVSPSANAVPLIATIDNRDGKLRPGMFARISIPVGKPVRAVAIPPEAVLRHDNQPFVFVEQENNVFQRVDVTTGSSSKEYTEIKTGLKPGEKVVCSGAFLLKSELLLEGEEE